MLLLCLYILKEKIWSTLLNDEKSHEGKILWGLDLPLYSKTLDTRFYLLEPYFK
jgi:hypothetical protein